MLRSVAPVEHVVAVVRELDAERAAHHVLVCTTVERLDKPRHRIDELEQRAERVERDRVYATQFQSAH